VSLGVWVQRPGKRAIYIPPLAVGCAGVILLGYGLYLDVRMCSVASGPACPPNSNPPCTYPADVGSCVASPWAAEGILLLIAAVPVTLFAVWISRTRDYLTFPNPPDPEKLD
jgi:hypothetical protein